MSELRDQLKQKEQDKLNKYRISYFYLATGMEGKPDIYPEKVIEAPTKELAVFIYHLMFMCPTTQNEIDRSGDSYAKTTFEEFLNQDEVYQYWGTTVEEL